MDISDQLLEAGRYGKEKLSPDDLNISLIGKCLELYSSHYLWNLSILIR